LNVNIKRQQCGVISCHLSTIQSVYTTDSSCKISKIALNQGSKSDLDYAHTCSNLPMPGHGHITAQQLTADDVMMEIYYNFGQQLQLAGCHTGRYSRSTHISTLTSDLAFQSLVKYSHDNYTRKFTSKVSNHQLVQKIVAKRPMDKQADAVRADATVRITFPLTKLIQKRVSISTGYLGLRIGLGLGLVLG